MSKEMRSVAVASYALVDVVRALNNQDIHEVMVTKEDGDLVVRWYIDDEDKQFQNKNEVEICGQAIKKP